MTSLQKEVFFDIGILRPATSHMYTRVSRGIVSATMIDVAVSRAGNRRTLRFVLSRETPSCLAEFLRLKMEIAHCDRIAGCAVRLWVTVAHATLSIAKRIHP